MTKRTLNAGGWAAPAIRWALACGLLALAQLVAPAADKKFALLRIGDQSLSNAVVLSTTRTDVFIQHAGGLANFKIADLDSEALQQLGDDVVASAERARAAASAPFLVRLMAREPAREPVREPVRTEANPSEAAEAPAPAWPAQVPRALPDLPDLPPGAWGVIAGVVLAFHLFFCFCAKRIVEKTGQSAGFLIWLPVLQWLPLLRAAGMGAGWFILWLLPGVNLVAHIVWCFKIVAARDKHVLWAVLLVLPFTNLLAFLYLAFSEGVEPPAASGGYPLAEAA